MALADNLYKWFRGLFSVHNDSSTVVDTLIKRLGAGHAEWELASSESNAAAAISATWFMRAKNDIKVLSAHYLPRGSLTANSANYATLMVQKADGAGGSATNLATITTQSTNMANGVPYALTVGSTDTVDAGNVIGFTTSKGGSGVAIPLGHIVVDYEER